MRKNMKIYQEGVDQLQQNSQQQTAANLNDNEDINYRKNDRGM